MASLSQGRTAAAQCGLFTHKSVPVIFEPPCINGLCFIKRVRSSVKNKKKPEGALKNNVCMVISKKATTLSLFTNG